jgi:hypothetical protein
MADKKRDILEFFEQSNFEQFNPTRREMALLKGHYIILNYEINVQTKPLLR